MCSYGNNKSLDELIKNQEVQEESRDFLINEGELAKQIGLGDVDETYVPAIKSRRERIERDFLSGRGIEEARAFDERELEKIGISYKDIANRMMKLLDKINWVKKKSRFGTLLSTLREAGFAKYHRKYETLQNGWTPYNTEFNDNRYLRANGLAGAFDAELQRIDNHSLIDGESTLEVYQSMSRLGHIYCPFMDRAEPGICKGISASTAYWIRNVKTGRVLAMNSVTAHLADAHHLLEKGNEYGITAGEFFTHFMQ